MQAVAEWQDTALSTLSVAPAGLAGCWIFQLLPFHTSARVRSSCVTGSR